MFPQPITRTRSAITDHSLTLPGRYGPGTDAGRRAAEATPPVHTRQGRSQRPAPPVEHEAVWPPPPPGIGSSCTDQEWTHDTYHHGPRHRRTAGRSAPVAAVARPVVPGDRVLHDP